MAELARFYGLVIAIYAELGSKHNLPHFHVHYGEFHAEFSIEDGSIIIGWLPTNKRKLVDAWYVIHQQDLIESWDKISKGNDPGKIDPLK